ncbi:acyl-CoA thioesterase [Natronobacterium texcoconense]|uniref:Acyl-CoA thioester hydrolase n=1 Tax=Natronobacterium texcoconense TaxID=1095778 RepID=A0A1H1AS63_NATTX|nr:thioesterase family protein [Natronobacterium texcoconense]SDQ42006.1 acyl-CoA thioester hydrolase [Natronobacterium texcoconense]
MNEKFTTEIPVRFRDLDPMDHVNHAVYASYIEAARIDYIDEVMEIRQQDAGFVIVNLEISYKRPLTRGDEPTVTLWVTDLGTTSCTIEYEIRTADGEIAATAETVMVQTNSEGQPEPLSDEVRERIAEYENLEATA